MKSLCRAVSLIVAPVLLAAGCAASAAGGRATPAVDDAALRSGEPPTLQELRNATYQGLEMPRGAVTLVDGRWEGEPYAEGGASRASVAFGRDFVLLGDLDGDGVAEAAVVLAASSGGSGTFDYLAVVKRVAGRLVNVATVALGDRVQVRSVRIEDGRLIVDAVRAGPQDAVCCPGELVRWSWTLARDRLELAAEEISGRLSLDSLAGTEWVLRWWGWDEPAPAEPAVTLSWVESRLAGASGCNHYSGAATDGATPGEVSLGPVMSTRMACGDPADLVERRFLAQLGGVVKYGFTFGQLALSFEADGTTGIMLFDPSPATGAE